MNEEVLSLFRATYVLHRLGVIDFNDEDLFSLKMHGGCEFNMVEVHGLDGVGMISVVELIRMGIK